MFSGPSAGEWRVRLASVEDAEVFVALVQRGFAESRRTPLPSSALGETVEVVRRSLDHDLGALLLLGQEPVGCVRFRLEPRDLARPARAWLASASDDPSAARAVEPASSLHLSRLVVVPEARGRGAARHLVTHLARAAAAVGVEWLRLTARSRYPDARPFWLALGFEVTGYSECYDVTELVTHLQRRVVAPSRPREGGSES